MSARIAKYPPIAGAGMDFHLVPPGSFPPPPPAPPNPSPMPSYPWAVIISSQVSGFALTGKWAWHRVTVEGIGNILWGHNWGPGQMHIPFPPVVFSPNMPLRVLASQTKYWLPSFSVREPVDGSAPGGDAPVAVSTPAWVTSTQNCQDAFGGWPYFLPSTFCFQLVSTKNVAFTLGDLFAGVIGMVGDAVAAVVGRALGGPNCNVQAIAGALSGAFLGQLLGRLPSQGQEADSAINALMNGAAMGGLGDNAGGGHGNAAGAIGGAFVSFLAGQVSNAVGSGPTYRRGIDGPVIDSSTGQELSGS